MSVLRSTRRSAPLVHELTRDVDLVLARAGQLGSGVGAVAGLAMIGASSYRATGLALVVLALAVGTFYTILHTMLATHSHARADAGETWNPPEWVRWLSPAVETGLPAAVLAILASTADVEYALRSWLPAQLFCALVVISVVRLDPKVPVLMGAGASALYAMLYGLWFGDALQGQTLFPPSVHLARSLSLLAMGGATALISWRLQTLFTDAASRLEEPNTFGPYQLGDEIASGGMGRVFEAWYAPPPSPVHAGAFRRHVALKVMHPHLAVDEAYVARFRNEAEIMSKLDHPNIVGVLDFGRVDGTWFLAMDFVGGRPLSDVLMERRRIGRPLSLPFIAQLGHYIATALEYAHERVRDADGRPLRVVHRDLSPSNVLVESSGRVRLVDFGVARALHGESQHTTSVLAGKPSYVAPEALRHGVVDPRADLWSLGVILWEALTNQRLFGRESEAASMMAVVDADILAPSAYHADLDPRWDRVVGRLLARDPQDRCPSASKLVDELAELRAHMGSVSQAELDELLSSEEFLDELPVEPTVDEGQHERARQREEAG